MSFPGNDNAFKPRGAGVPPNTDRQTPAASPPSHSANSSLTNGPSLGTPSRIHSALDTSPFSFTALPTEILLHTFGFLDSREIILLSRASNALYTMSGAMQRSVPGEHWRGGSTNRTIEQRQLTCGALLKQQEYLPRQRLQAVQTVAPFDPAALQKLQAIESQVRIDTIAQASSIGSRFRHVRFSMNDGPLVLEIGEALSGAIGWQHLELIVSNVQPLACFLLQLGAKQIANRAASPGNAQQPGRELSICLRSSRPPLPEAEILHIVHVLKALQADACGLRVVSLELAHKYVAKFIDFIGQNPYLEQIVAELEFDAVPLLEALRASRLALRSLSLSFDQVDFDQPRLGSLFSQSGEWQLDHLSIKAGKTAASLFPPAFLASCKIRHLHLGGLDFYPEPNVYPECDGPEAFGTALARNASIEKIEFSSCRFRISHDLMRLLDRLSASTSLRCLVLVGCGMQHECSFDGKLIVDRIAAWTSLSEVYFDSMFLDLDRGRAAIGSLHIARPGLNIFIDNQLLESLSDWQNADAQTDDSDVVDSDDWTDLGEDDDPLADIDQVIQRAKDAEKQ